jgi:Phosphate-selective porin O and P
MIRFCIIIVMMLGVFYASAANFSTNFIVFEENDSLPQPIPAKVENHSKKWYEKLSIRGYTQMRYNRLLETNENLKMDTDKSVGKNGGFLLRRGRLVLSGDVHEKLYIYIQNDFAASTGSFLNVMQLRDGYFDWSLDSKKEFRIRAGQSKVPFGFLNMQSSSNRIGLERDEALNGSVPGERELGASFIWAPAKKRELFKKLANAKMRGSGDYGVVAFGVFNGQGINKGEENNDLHRFLHLTWPFEINNGQIFEIGVHGFTGKYRPATISVGKEVRGTSDFNYKDANAAASFTIYPQPFGLTAELMTSNTAQYDAEKNEIVQKKSAGGFVLAYFQKEIKNQLVSPFVRYQWFKGGKKSELDARFYDMTEWEFGAEWQISPAIELTAAYVVSDRFTSDATKPNNDQKGNLLRLQLQFNY